MKKISLILISLFVIVAAVGCVFADDSNSISTLKLGFGLDDGLNDGFNWFGQIDVNGCGYVTQLDDFGITNYLILGSHLGGGEEQHYY